MSFIGKWLGKRRIRKLEEINREIEALKVRGPGYIESKEKAKIGTFVMRDTSFGLLIILILCIIAIIGLSLLYRQKFSDITDKYNEKLSELELKNEELTGLTEELNQTSSKLKFKEKVESDLSSQYTTLETKNQQLEETVDDLQDKVISKDNEINSLKTQITAKDKKLSDIEDCIEDNSVSDKEDCI